MTIYFDINYDNLFWAYIYYHLFWAQGQAIDWWIWPLGMETGSWTSCVVWAVTSCTTSTSSRSTPRYRIWNTSALCIWPWPPHTVFIQLYRYMYETIALWVWPSRQRKCLYNSTGIKLVLKPTFNHYSLLLNFKFCSNLIGSRWLFSYKIGPCYITNMKYKIGERLVLNKNYCDDFLIKIVKIFSLTSHSWLTVLI